MLVDVIASLPEASEIGAAHGSSSRHIDKGKAADKSDT